MKKKKKLSESLSESVVRSLSLKVCIGICPKNLNLLNLLFWGNPIGEGSLLCISFGRLSREGVAMCYLSLVWTRTLRE